MFVFTDFEQEVVLPSASASPSAIHQSASNEGSDDSDDSDAEEGNGKAEGKENHPLSVPSHVIPSSVNLQVSHIRKNIFEE